MTTAMKTRRVKTQITSGNEAFDIRDQKGRVVGYTWTISNVDVIEITDPDDHWYYSHTAGDPMHFVEVWGSPTRDGKNYGPAFNTARVASVEEAEARIAKRIKSAKRTASKKFAPKVTKEMVTGLGWK